MKRSNILKQSTNKYGYKTVKLEKDGLVEEHQVHYLVAKTFLPNPHGYLYVRHKDGNKENNRADNLEWVEKL